MMSAPQGDRGPAIGYQNHIKALKQSKDIHIKELSELKSIEELENFDYFWFYVRFDPKLYFYIKENFPNKKVICGPNVIFENAKSIPSDDWESWFLNNVKPDVSINVAEYYNNYTKSFFKNCDNFQTLPYCYQSPRKYTLGLEKNIDVLFYIKKRRYDHSNYEVFNKIISEIKKSNNHVETVIYGSHTREEYLDKIYRSKFVVWSSIDDYCSLAQLEAISQGVPIIGTPHNCTIYKNKKLIIDDVSKITDAEFVQWLDNETVIESYCKKINNALIFANDLSKFAEKEFKTNYSYSAYVDNVKRMLEHV